MKMHISNDSSLKQVTVCPSGSSAVRYGSLQCEALHISDAKHQPSYL